VGYGHEVSRLNSSDGSQYVSIWTQGGLFYFVEHKKFTEVEPYQTYDYFAPTRQSGLYASATDAERAARLELAWLRDET